MSQKMYVPSGQVLLLPGRDGGRGDGEPGRDEQAAVLGDAQRQDLREAEEDR
jgi:hypothetical protein